MVVVSGDGDELGTKASSPVVPPSTSHARAHCRRPHPPPSVPRRSSSPAAASSGIHAPHRSSSPTAASSTVHATSELVAGGRILHRLDELARYVLVVLRADDGGEGSTFALYFLICRRVRARLLPGAGEELAVAGQCVDGVGVGATAGVAAEELTVAG
uniref:Uncharacterized protein n=1 Tax=Oryza sativa subsp. japonica TaxID=39947 RepID=Q69T93_ORYSJ|nr:hypothetical protein [Oryza sativa Japonica Group]BAD61875.1 hypothetical protein [Oryza sativa Japonica Group]